MTEFDYIKAVKKVLQEGLDNFEPDECAAFHQEVIKRAMALIEELERSKA